MHHAMLCVMQVRRFGESEQDFDRFFPCETWNWIIGRSMSHYLGALDIYPGATYVSGLRTVLRRIYSCY